MKDDGSKNIAAYTPDERKPIRIFAEDCPIVAAVHVTLNGTNDTSVTRTHANNGNVEINYIIDGETIPGGKWPLSVFAKVQDACGGLVRADSTVSSTFRFVYEIPFNNPETDNPNGIHLGSRDSIELWFDDMNAAAAFDAATLTVKAVPGESVMDYLHFFGSSNEMLASGGQYNENLPCKNIDMLLIELSSGGTAPDPIGFIKRGQVFDDLKGEWKYLVDRTRGRYQLESAPATEYILWNFSRKNPQGYVGNTKLSYVGAGSGTLYWYAIGRIPVKQMRTDASARTVAVKQAALSTMVANARSV